MVLVRNLHTEYISPQYHIVFDDKFETVFFGGKSEEEMDKICQKLFDGERENYVKKEYGGDGVLIYEPPPLDKVWFSEPERRDRQDALRRQQQITRRREELKSKDIKHQVKRESVSLLVELDIDSDDDFWPDDPEDIAVFEPGGSDDAAGKDLWTDHPAQQQNSPSWEPVEPPEEASEEAPEEVPEEVDNGLGRVTNGKIRSSQNIPNYKEGRRAGLFAHVSTPLGVGRLSVKRICYCKRLATRKQVGNKMFRRAKMEEVPTVETLMASPLSKFIHFAANDCGYARTRLELIANWVHPLFLKAKSEASKEDNPSWRQAMNGPFKEEYLEAACKEVKTLQRMKAWKVVDREDGMNAIQSIWAFKLKRFPDGLIKKFKARFCARGDQQLEGIYFFETYAPVVQWAPVQMMLILEILMNLKSK